jgi:hypothetical protein
VRLYEEDGPEIFDRSIFQRLGSAHSLLDEKYDSETLDRFLADKRLSETRPHLLVPAYDTPEPGLYLFKTAEARRSADDDFPLSVVPRAAA